MRGDPNHPFILCRWNTVREAPSDPPPLQWEGHSNCTRGTPPPVRSPLTSSPVFIRRKTSPNVSRWDSQMQALRLGVHVHLSPECCPDPSKYDRTQFRAQRIYYLVGVWSALCTGMRLAKLAVKSILAMFLARYWIMSFFIQCITEFIELLSSTATIYVTAQIYQAPDWLPLTQVNACVDSGLKAPLRVLQEGT